MLAIDVNTDSFVVLANKLDNLNRSALPVAVRRTLNSTAFDVKQRTMLEMTKKQFVNRQANFFKANSKVIQATGFNVNEMESQIGFFEDRLKNKATNWAVKDLEQQEHGGSILGRDFITMNTGRVSNSPNKITKSGNRISDIKEDFVNQRSSRFKAKTRGGRFRQAIALAMNPSDKELNRRSRNRKKAGLGVSKSLGAFVLGDYQGKRFLWKIDGWNQKTGKPKLCAMMIFKKNRVVKIKKATHFMERASIISLQKTPHFFYREAENQIEKHWAKL